MEAIEITVKTSVNAQEFWDEVTGCAWETWDWWTGVHFDSPLGAEIGAISIDYIDPETDEECEETRVITIHDLVSAYEKASAAHYIDWQNLDASSGDVIFQYAIFGEAVYG